VEHGVDQSRILVENRSQTTVQNAQLTGQILLQEYPQVKQLAIVTSDYHVPLGCLLFSEHFIFLSSALGIEPLQVIANAGYKAEFPLPYTPSTEAPDVWAVFDAIYS
jgi:hypothetical protein